MKGEKQTAKMASIGDLPHCLRIPLWLAFEAMEGFSGREMMESPFCLTFGASKGVAG
jgi:hypothetical protein